MHGDAPGSVRQACAQSSALGGRFLQLKLLPLPGPRPAHTCPLPGRTRGGQPTGSQPGGTWCSLGAGSLTACYPLKGNLVNGSGVGLGFCIPIKHFQAVHFHQFSAQSQAAGQGCHPISRTEEGGQACEEVLWVITVILRTGGTGQGHAR